MDYWVTLVDEAANNCGANLTREQVLSIANDVKIGHEQYGMAYYEPPASEAYQRLEQEWRVRYVELERRFNAYRDRAEAAVARTVGCRDHQSAMLQSSARISV